MLCNIDQIKVSNRIRKDFGDIHELAEDIKQNGLINPPVVDTENNLIAGERRLMALKSLGYQQVEVRVVPVRDEHHALEMEISENEQRKDFTPLERYEMFKRRYEYLKANHSSESDLEPRRQARTDAHISETTVQRVETILDNQGLVAEEDFQNWTDGKLSTNKVYQSIKQQLAEAEHQRDEAKAQLVEREHELSVAGDELQAKDSLIERLKKDSAIESVADQLEHDTFIFYSKVNSFLKDVGGYAYIANQFLQLPDAERAMYQAGVQAVMAWAQNILNVL